MDASFDGIIIGAGHNGLILQAYLGRLGLRVLSLDRNLQPGGGLSTIEDPAFPGVFHNIHSVFHRAVTLAPWYRDLDLKRRGVRYIEPELNVVAVREDGGSLCWYTDLDRTCRSLAEFSPRDVATFRALAETFAEVASRVILPCNAHPPLTRDALRARLSRSAAGRKFLEAEPRYRYNEVGPLFGLNVALREPPHYRAAAQTPDLDRAFMTILGLETPEVIFEMYRAHPAGRITRPLTLWGAAPSVHDPSQARDGFHTAFMWEKVPFACSADLPVGGSAERKLGATGESAERKLGAAADPAHWDTWKERHGDELLARWAEFAPNVQGDTIASRYALTPLDTVRHLPKMAGGDLTVGWLGEEQMGAAPASLMPTPALSRYATPVGGLYMAGSCMHPGGNITGYPGYNAAGVIARALGLEPWWTPPDWEADSA